MPGNFVSRKRLDCRHGGKSDQGGVEILETEDGMEITGTETLRGCEVDSFGDHRIAMSMLIAGLVANGETTVTDTDCIATSFPTFIELLEKVCR
jgi:3-phosphoshikimate 1-carboxyvinyltransferase